MAAAQASAVRGTNRARPSTHGCSASKWRNVNNDKPGKRPGAYRRNCGKLEGTKGGRLTATGVVETPGVAMGRLPMVVLAIANARWVGLTTRVLTMSKAGVGRGVHITSTTATVRGTTLATR